MIDVKRYMIDPAYRAGVDDARAEVQERGNRLTDLQQAQELAAIDARALNSAYGSGIQEYRAALADMQRQRDAARADVEQLRGVLVRNLYACAAEINALSPVCADLRTRLIDLAEREQLPHAAVALLNAADEFEIDIKKNYAEFSSVPTVGLTESAVWEMATTDPESLIWLAWYIRDIKKTRQLIAMVLAKGYGLSHAPEAVCDQILRECRTSGEPDMKTLQWLSDEWLSRLNRKPSRETLQTGLRTVQEKISSGNKQREFCKAKHIDDRTFRNYQSWWDAINKEAKRLPDSVTLYIA